MGHLDPAVPAGLAFPVEAWDELRRLYSAGERAYHTFDHVAEVLDHWAAVDAEGGWSHRAETWLAVLLHDAVYVPGEVDNEVRSAELVKDFVNAWGPTLAEPPHTRADAAMTEHLVRLTARHGRLKRRDVTDEEALFLDCDMAVLGSSPERFDAYDAAIRLEYSAIVPPAILDRGRRQFLEHLLGNARIFLSERFHARYDAAARDNLRRALASGQ